METTELKGKYPSEQNTKAIACRVPLADWVKFFNDAKSLGVNMNDYLILKLYSNNTLGKVIKSEEYLEITKEEIIESFVDGDGDIKPAENLVRSILSENKYGIPELCIYEKGYLGFNLTNEKTEVTKEDYLELRYAYYMRLNDLIQVQKRLEFIRNNNAPNLVKIRTELSQLIAEKFGHGKDAKEIKKEIFDLLKELE